jgi:undecaprenyl phosphate-alpha-L-ara4FN deformylase
VTRLVAIKCDVDTHDGMRDGLPLVLESLARHRVRASVFLAMGPDRSGLAMLQMLKHPRFALKMAATRAPALYGMRTALSGTLLPARRVGSAFPGLIRRVVAEGHEAAVHAWDHRAWQDDLPRFRIARIRAHLRRACAALEAILGRPSAGIGAPSWTTTPESLRLQDDLPLAYASDLRGGAPCRLATPLGVMRLPQLPATGPCLEELLAQGVRDHAALAERLFAALSASDSPLRVLTIHAEVEGGPYRAVLELMLPRLRELGEVVTMQEAAARLATAGDLPLRRWCLRRVSGRAFPVSGSRALQAAAT